MRVVELEPYDKYRIVTLKVRMSQYAALLRLVEGGVFPSVSEAVREGIRMVLDTYSASPGARARSRGRAAVIRV